MKNKNLKNTEERLKGEINKQKNLEAEKEQKEIEIIQLTIIPISLMALYVTLTMQFPKNLLEIFALTNLKRVLEFSIPFSTIIAIILINNDNYYNRIKKGNISEIISEIGIQINRIISTLFFKLNIWAGGICSVIYLFKNNIPKFFNIYIVMILKSIITLFMANLMILFIYIINIVLFVVVVRGKK